MAQGATLLSLSLSLSLCVCLSHHCKLPRTDVIAMKEGGKVKTLFWLMGGGGTGKSVTIAVVCKKWVDCVREERSQVCSEGAKGSRTDLA